MPHKFRLGQSVKYFGAPFGDRAGDLEFTIVTFLPEASYRIKAADEPNERVAREYELKPTSKSIGKLARSVSEGSGAGLGSTQVTQHEGDHCGPRPIL